MRKNGLGFLFLSTLTLLAFGSMNAGVFAQDEAPEKKANAAADDSVPMTKLEEPKPSSEPAEEKVEETKLLTIGSDAPSLDIENWIHDGDGKFEHVTEFKAGKVYIVEFWATWCGPCIAAMPHIVETQQKYADQGVQIISVSTEPVETINKFLEREVPGMRVPVEETDEDADENADDENEDADDGTRAVTFDELTRSYCLTSDPDRSVSDDYMRAAGQNGIPCAFIVGKDAKIEWIGHPMSMDKTLEAVVNDSWDREAFAEEFIEGQMADKLYGEIVTLMRNEKIEAALEKINGYLKTGTHEPSISRMQRMKMQVLLSEESMREEAKVFVLELLEANPADAILANSIGWSVYRLAATDELDDNAFLKSVLDRVSEAADSIDGTDRESFKPYLLDTVAHLYSAMGNVDMAIETQKRAIELVEDERGKERLQRFLDELTAEPETDD